MAVRLASVLLGGPVAEPFRSRARQPWPDSWPQPAVVSETIRARTSPERPDPRSVAGADITR